MTSLLSDPISGVKRNLLALRGREEQSSQGAHRKMAMPWAAADNFKEEKSQPKPCVLEEERREVPQLLKLPCQHL